ncbi:ImmA/IrrE family metallo-endopeptidase [Oceanobacillus jeddahense]|uniref:ImmA/IrrE family metallo-endopeptidase n=1 Tax=Oceanobacillus jeddahense TaxID=1462527 RepID=A0ABY5JSI2_9BACI|nr:ImmA/IrrE family metallo-endopeptidase [Oceanobacillus jeddahense]UUI03179.1 ImmA/IrrE family metallo-endopeptidase [Oceanobacillus jeddahense]
MSYLKVEKFVEALYKRLNIQNPEELSISTIAEALKIEIIYSETISMRIDNFIVLPHPSNQNIWQNFGHELGHYFFHEGDQRFMHSLFIDLQENQANHFAYHFCIPTFMLHQLQIENVYDIVQHFPVEFPFALHRLEMYRNKHITLYEKPAFYLAG